MASKKTALTIALGSAFAASFTLATAAHAAENPFSMQTLDKGYMVADAGDKTQETKNGKAKKKADPAAAKAEEAKCGAAHMKASEGKCGGKKTPAPSTEAMK